MGNPEPSPSTPISFRGPGWPLTSRALDSHPSILCSLSVMLRPLSSNCLFLCSSPSRSQFTTRKVSSLGSFPEAEPMSQGVVSQLHPVDFSSQAQATERALRPTSVVFTSSAIYNLSLTITFLEYPLNIMSESSIGLAGGEKQEHRAGNSVHGKGLRALKFGLNLESTCLHFHPFYSNDVAAVTASAHCELVLPELGGLLCLLWKHLLISLSAFVRTRCATVYL